MKRFGNLYPQIISFDNLYHASRRAFRGKTHRPDAALFYLNLEKELLVLNGELSSAAYIPDSYRKFSILEPKQRLITAAAFRDRVVHHAICRVMEPIWDSTLIYDTYACRQEKGQHAAIRRAQYFSRCFSYFFKCDVQKYFDSIDQDVLRRILKKKIKDRRLLTLLDLIIYSYCADPEKPGIGLPLGNLTRQYFANLYLGELDQHLKSGLQIKGYVRYMDDMLCFSNSKSRMDEIHDEIRFFLYRRLNLFLKPSASVLAPVTEGIPYFGLRIFRNTIRLQGERWRRFQKNYRRQLERYSHGKITEDRFLNSVGGMIEYTRWGDTLNLRRNFFKSN